MKDNLLIIDSFIDTSSFPFKDIFDDTRYAWEVLLKINLYITKYFSKGVVKGNYQERDDVYIGEGTVIQSGVEIAGPALIGKNCFIGHASLLRNGCILGDNVN